jgi:hypothetical protein
MTEKKVKPTIGTPTMVLLPANNYCFKASKKQHKIVIPRKGTYHDLDPNFYDKESGEFLLLDEKSNTMYMPAISKVLFGVEKYPDLKQNEVFAPIALVFKEEEVEIIGQVIEMLNPDNPECSK